MFIRLLHWMLFCWTAHLQKRITELETQNRDLSFELEEADDSTSHWRRKYHELLNQRKVDYGPSPAGFIGDRFNSIQ